MIAAKTYVVLMGVEGIEHIVDQFLRADWVDTNTHRHN